MLVLSITPYIPPSFMPGTKHRLRSVMPLMLIGSNRDGAGTDPPFVTPCGARSGRLPFRIEGVSLRSTRPFRLTRTATRMVNDGILTTRHPLSSPFSSTQWPTQPNCDSGIVPAVPPVLPEPAKANRQGGVAQAAPAAYHSCSGGAVSPLVASSSFEKRPYFKRNGDSPSLLWICAHGSSWSCLTMGISAGDQRTDASSSVRSHLASACSFSEKADP